MKVSIYRRSPVTTVGISLLWLTALSGCGEGAKLATVPVSGTVTLNGQPLEAAQVAFIPNDVNSGKPANGTTDASGNFQLKTLAGGANMSIGALPGEYKVTVIKAQTAAGSMPGMGQANSTSPESILGAPGSTTPPPSGVPAIYGDPAKSGLTATVKASDNQPFKFELKGE